MGDAFDVGLTVFSALSLPGLRKDCSFSISSSVSGLPLLVLLEAGSVLSS